MIYLIILFALLIAVFLSLSFYNHTLIVDPIMGCLLGCLYKKDYWEEEQVYEHTIQIAFLFITFTFQWETNG